MRTVMLMLAASALVSGCAGHNRHLEVIPKDFRNLDVLHANLIFGDSAADPYQHALIIEAVDNARGCNGPDCPILPNEPVYAVWRVTSAVPSGSERPDPPKTLRATVCVTTTATIPTQCSPIFYLSERGATGDIAITMPQTVSGGFGILVDLELWTGAALPAGPGNPPLMRVARASTILPLHPQ